MDNAIQKAHARMNNKRFTSRVPDAGSIVRPTSGKVEDFAIFLFNEINAGY